VTIAPCLASGFATRASAALSRDQVVEARSEVVASLQT